MLINVKMPIIVGSLTFVSIINTSESLKSRNDYFFSNLQTCLLLCFLRISYAFWAPKYALQITITELRTQENPILAKLSFILVFIMSAMTGNRMIVIVSTVLA